MVSNPKFFGILLLLTGVLGLKFVTMAGGTVTQTAIAPLIAHSATRSRHAVEMAMWILVRIATMAKTTALRTAIAQPPVRNARRQELNTPLALAPAKPATRILSTTNATSQPLVSTHLAMVTTVLAEPATEPTVSRQQMQNNSD
jgi:hypothetical protein